MKFKRDAWTILAVVLVLAAGCTGSEVLQPSVSDVGVGAQGNPAGAGRFESSEATIAGVFAEPLDPESRAALGDIPVNLLATPQDFDFAQANQVILATTSLPAGVYQVTGVRINEFAFRDTNPPSPPTTCLENFAVIPTPSFSGFVNAEVFRIDLAAPVPFTVRRDGTSNVLVEIDGPAVTAAYLAAIECRSTQFCTNTGAIPPCLNNFDFATFRGVLTSSVTVVSN